MSQSLWMSSWGLKRSFIIGSKGNIKNQQGGDEKWWLIWKRLTSHFPAPDPETAKFGQGWDAHSLRVLTPGQALLSNKPELKVQTPEDSQNLDLKHPSLTHV